MPDLQIIAIDPYLLHFASPCHSEQVLREFINGILAWSAATRRVDVKLTLSNSVKAALFQDNVYPHDHLVQQTMATFKVEDVDPTTLFNLTRRLIDRTAALEDVTGITDILYDQNQVAIDPNAFVTRLSPRSSNAFCDSLLAIGIHNGVCEHVPGIVVASKDGPGKPDSSIELSMACDVVELSPQEILPERRSTLPFRLDEEVRLYLSFSSLLNDLDPIQTLGDPVTNQSLTDAIDACVEQHLTNGTGDRNSLLEYSIGPHFLESLRRWSFLSRNDLAMICIDTCARIIVKCPKKALSEFRDSANANAPQMGRPDGSLAWRTHLTKHGAGYRLMFWTNRNGSIEFANIGDKDELIIL